MFPAEDLRRLLTLQAVLVNETGTLQSLLAGLSAAGADVVTIHQQKPKGELAQVTLTVDTSAVEMDVLTLLEQLRTRSFVRSIELVDD